MTTPNRWLPIALIVLGMVSRSGCARRGPVHPTDQDGRNATIAFYHLQARYDAIAAGGRRLADRRVPLSGIAALIKDLCTNRCEAEYFRCVVNQSKVGLAADFDAARAPKDFPFEIPECTRDPDCGGARIVSQPSHASCEQAQTTCLKTCEVP